MRSDQRQLGALGANCSRWIRRRRRPPYWGQTIAIRWRRLWD